ncbi:tetratricopeptide repeat protein [Frankia sp. ACN1ag]|uniref:tetratricopeptide repeat protein n=1 Tax=Frankia sp. ACN1ag TaxID=102891 RepID=UPI0009F85718
MAPLAHCASPPPHRPRPPLRPGRIRREPHPGPDHPDTLTSRHNLAGAYRSVGRLDEAITLHEQTLTESVRVLGQDHPVTATIRENLAAARTARTG